LLQKWPKNIPNVEDDAYETLVFTYNRELDLIELASSITISDVEKESSPPYLEDTMMDSKEENEFGGHHFNGYTTVRNGFH